MVFHDGSILCTYASMVLSGVKKMEGRRNEGKWTKVKEGDVIRFAVLHHCGMHKEFEKEHNCVSLGCEGNCDSNISTFMVSVKKVTFCSVPLFFIRTLVGP